MSIADEIERLQRLRDSGALSEDEFAQAKAALLSKDGSQSNFKLPGGASKWWTVGLHLSQFAGYAVPLAGFVVPIVIWQVVKEDHPEIDEHGRELDYQPSALHFAQRAAGACRHRDSVVDRAGHSGNRLPDHRGHSSQRWSLLVVSSDD